MSVTRAQIRSWVGSLLGETLTLTATATGNYTTFTDAVNLAREDGYLEGRQFICTYGSNDGVIGRVASNSKATRSLSVEPTMAASFDVGDVMELWFRRDQGPSITEVHDAIARNVDAVADVVLQPAMASGAAAFDRTNPIITEVSANWRFFSGIDWQDPEGIWHPVPAADIRLAPLGNDPYVDVEIRNRSRTLMDGMNYRVKGYSRHGAANADNTAIFVDSEWLTHQVAAQLLLASSGRMSDQAAAERKAQFMQTLADARRPKPGIRPRGMLVRLHQ